MLPPGNEYMETLPEKVWPDHSFYENVKGSLGKGIIKSLNTKHLRISIFLLHDPKAKDMEVFSH